MDHKASHFDEAPGSQGRSCQGWLQLGLTSTSAPLVELNLFPERPWGSMGLQSNPRFDYGRGSPIHNLHTMTNSSMVNLNSLRNSRVDVGLKVISPPPSSRRQAGVWFILRAAQNQGKEPFLPQIPKSYLRIKDKRMTVRLLMKYLANKLGLDSEFEVEIACRGQQIPASWTLQQVRDNIWCCYREVVILLPDSQSMEHLMTLEYRRRTEASIASLERR